MPPSSRHVTRHTAPPLPSRIPNKSEHTGKKEETRAKSSAYKFAEMRAPSTSFLHQLLRDRGECLLYFAQHHRKIQLQHRFLRIEHHIHRSRAIKYCAPHAYGFPKPPLDPIPFDRTAQQSSHREPDPRPFPRRAYPWRSSHRSFSLRPPQIKHGHVRGKLTSPLFVNTLEV